MNLYTSYSELCLACCNLLYHLKVGCVQCECGTENRKMRTRKICIKTQTLGNTIKHLHFTFRTFKTQFVLPIRMFNYEC